MANTFDCARKVKNIIREVIAERKIWKMKRTKKFFAPKKINKATRKKGKTGVLYAVSRNPSVRGSSILFSISAHY